MSSNSPLTPSHNPAVASVASPHLSSPYYDGSHYGTGPGTPNGATSGHSSRASNAHDSPYHLNYASPGALSAGSPSLFAMDMKHRVLLNSGFLKNGAEMNTWNEMAAYEAAAAAAAAGHALNFNGGGGGGTPGHSTPGHATPGHSTPGHATPGHITPGHVMSMESYGNAEVEELMVDSSGRGSVIQSGAFAGGVFSSQDMPARSHSSAGFYYGAPGGSTPLGPAGDVMSAPNSVISAASHYSTASSPYGQQQHSIHSSSSSSSMTPPSVKGGNGGGGGGGGQGLQRPNQTLTPQLAPSGNYSSGKYCDSHASSSPVTSPLSVGSLPQARCHSNSSAAAASLAPIGGGNNNSNPNTPYTPLNSGPMTPGGGQGPMTPGPLTPGAAPIGNGPRTPGGLKREESSTTSSCGSPFPSNSPADYPMNLFTGGAGAGPKRGGYVPAGGSPASSVSTLKRSPSVEPMSPYNSRLAMSQAMAPSPASLVNHCNSLSSPATPGTAPGTPYCTSAASGIMTPGSMLPGYPPSNASVSYMTPYHQPQYPPSAASLYGLDSSAYGSEADLEEDPSPSIYEDAEEDGDSAIFAKRLAMSSAASAALSYDMSPMAMLQNQFRLFEDQQHQQQQQLQAKSIDRSARGRMKMQAEAQAKQQATLLAMQQASQGNHPSSLQCHQFGGSSSSSYSGGSSTYEPTFADDGKAVMLSPAHHQHGHHPQAPFSPLGDCHPGGKYHHQTPLPINGSARHSMMAMGNPFSTPTSVFGSYDLYNSTVPQQSFSSSASNSPSTVGSTPIHQSSSSSMPVFSRGSGMTAGSTPPASYSSMPSPTSLPTFRSSFKSMAASSQSQSQQSQLRSSLRGDYSDFLSKHQSQQQQQQSHQNLQSQSQQAAIAAAAAAHGAQSPLGPYNGSLERQQASSSNSSASHHSHNQHQLHGLSARAQAAAARLGNPPVSKTTNPIESISFDPKTGLMKVRKKRGRPRKNPLPPPMLPAFITASGGGSSERHLSDAPTLAVSSSSSAAAAFSGSSVGSGGPSCASSAGLSKVDDFEEPFKPLPQDSDPYAFPSYTDPPASSQSSSSPRVPPPSSHHLSATSQSSSSSLSQSLHTTSSTTSSSTTSSSSTSMSHPSMGHHSQHSQHHLVHSKASQQQYSGDVSVKRPRGRPRANDPNRPPPKAKAPPTIASIIPSLPGQPVMKRGRGRPKSLKTLVKEAEAAVAAASANGAKVPEELLEYLATQRAALQAQNAQSETHQRMAERHQITNLNRGALASMMLSVAGQTGVPGTVNRFPPASSHQSSMSHPMARSSNSNSLSTTSTSHGNALSNHVSTIQSSSTSSISSSSVNPFKSAPLYGAMASMSSQHKSSNSSSSLAGPSKLRHLSSSSSSSSSDSSDDSSTSSTDTDDEVTLLAPEHRPLDPISTLTHLPPLKAPCDMVRSRIQAPPPLPVSRPAAPVEPVLPALSSLSGPGGPSGSGGPSSGPSSSSSGPSGSGLVSSGKAALPKPKPSTSTSASAPADESTSETSDDESSYLASSADDDDTSSSSNDDNGRDDDDVHDIDDSLSSFSSSSSARKNRPPRSETQQQQQTPPRSSGNTQNSNSSSSASGGGAGRRPSNGAPTSASSSGGKEIRKSGTIRNSTTAKLMAALKANRASSSSRQSQSTVGESATPAGPKRRGRPPGSKNKPKSLYVARPAGKPKLPADSFFATTHLASLNYSDEEDDNRLISNDEREFIAQQRTLAKQQALLLAQQTAVPEKKKRGRPRSTDRLKAEAAAAALAAAAVPPPKLPKLVLKLARSSSSASSTPTTSRSPAGRGRSSTPSSSASYTSDYSSPAPVTRSSHQGRPTSSPMKVRVLSRASAAASSSSAFSIASSGHHAAPVTRRASSQSSSEGPNTAAALSTRLTARIPELVATLSTSASTRFVASSPGPKIRIKVPRTEAETFVCSMQINDEPEPKPAVPFKSKSVLPKKRERPMAPTETLKVKEPKKEAPSCSPVPPLAEAQAAESSDAQKEPEAQAQPQLDCVDRVVKDLVNYLCDLAAIQVLQEGVTDGEDVPQSLERKALQELLYRVENAAALSEEDSAVRNLQLMEFGGGLDNLRSTSSTEGGSHSFRIPANPPALTPAGSVHRRRSSNSHLDFHNHPHGHPLLHPHPQMGPSFEVSSDEQSSAINSIISCLEAPASASPARLQADLLIENSSSLLLSQARFLSGASDSRGHDLVAEMSTEADIAAANLMLESSVASIEQPTANESVLPTIEKVVESEETRNILDALPQTPATPALPALTPTPSPVRPVPSMSPEPHLSPVLAQSQDFFETGNQMNNPVENLALEEEESADLSALESNLSVPDLLPEIHAFPADTEQAEAMMHVPDTSASDLALLDNLIQTEEANNEVVDSIFAMGQQQQQEMASIQTTVSVNHHQSSPVNYDNSFNSNMNSLQQASPYSQPGLRPGGLAPRVQPMERMKMMHSSASMDGHHRGMIPHGPLPPYQSQQHTQQNLPYHHQQHPQQLHSPMGPRSLHSMPPEYHSSSHFTPVTSAVSPSFGPHSFGPSYHSPQPPSGLLRPGPAGPPPHYPIHGGDPRAGYMAPGHSPMSFEQQTPTRAYLDGRPSAGPAFHNRPSSGRQTPEGFLQHVPPSRSSLLSPSSLSHHSYPGHLGPPHYLDLRSSNMMQPPPGTFPHARSAFDSMRHLPPPQANPRHGQMMMQHNGGGAAYQQQAPPPLPMYPHESSMSRNQQQHQQSTQYHSTMMPTGRQGVSDFRPLPPSSYQAPPPSAQSLMSHQYPHARPEITSASPPPLRALNSSLFGGPMGSKTTHSPPSHRFMSNLPTATTGNGFSSSHITPANPNKPTPGAAFFSSAAPQVRPSAPARPSQSAPNLSQLLSSINPTPPEMLAGEGHQKILLEAKQPAMIRDALESKLRSISGFNSDKLHDLLTKPDMLGAMKAGASGNSSHLKDILTEAMESIHHLDGDEVQRLLAGSTPRSRRMSTTSDLAGQNESNFLDELFSESFGEGDQAILEEELRVLQELSSFDGSGTMSDISGTSAGPGGVSTSRRSSRTSADQLLATILEKGLLSLKDTTVEVPQGQTERGTQKSPTDGHIRSLLSEMVDSVQNDATQPESELPSTGHPLMASLMTPPVASGSGALPAFGSLKPKEALPKPKPEKPVKVTLKYLLETIDGNSDDEVPFEVPKRGLFTTTTMTPTITSEYHHSQSQFRPQSQFQAHSQLQPQPQQLQPQQPSAFTSNTLEPLSSPSEIMSPPALPSFQSFSGTPMSQQQDFSETFLPESASSMNNSAMMSAINALDSLEPIYRSNEEAEYLIEAEVPPTEQVEPLVPALVDVPETAAPENVPEPIEVIDLEAEEVPQPLPIVVESINPPVVAPIQAKQQTPTSSPEIIEILPSPPALDNAKAPMVEPKELSEKIESQKAPSDELRSDSPDQSIYVELLNDIVEMASDSVLLQPATESLEPPTMVQSTPSPSPTPAKSEPIEKKNFDLDNKQAQLNSKELLHDFLFSDKTVDSEVSTFFANQLGASSKRRRSVEVYSCLTTTTTPPLPLISSTNVISLPLRRSLRSNSLKNSNSEEQTTPGNVRKQSESQSTPESRAVSPDRTPTPVISTTIEPIGDFKQTDLSVASKRSATQTSECSPVSGKGSININPDGPPAKRTRRRQTVDLEEDETEKMETDKKSTTKLKKATHKVTKSATYSGPCFRTRSRSLVIDMSSSELSVKSTDSGHHTRKQGPPGVILDFSNFCSNKRSKKRQQQTANGRPTKKAKVETITISDDEEEEKDVSASTSSETSSTRTRKEPSVQHPDISSSVDDDSASCRFKHHRKCCCHSVDEEDEEETEEPEEGEGECSKARHHCCRHHRCTVNGSGHTANSNCSTSPGNDGSSTSVVVKHTSSAGSGKSGKGGKSDSAPVTIHTASGISINFKTEIVVSHAAENATTIIHINPSKSNTETSTSNSTSTSTSSKSATSQTNGK